ncbi:hypothetical protein EVC29_107 [Rhizobium phage RHph_Y52]|nr:hypothetical protein EVC16_107 [Rhizobium phage RHph_Y21]QIG76808.1 hypothetical protein EVC29_107 [Rhizobium phage RHph_Y52]
MNKKEQAAFDANVIAMQSARALRWPEPMTRAMIETELLSPRAVEVPSEYGGSRKVVTGWDYNEHTISVFEVAADLVSSCRIYNGKPSSWSRGGRIFATKEQALRALRYDLTVKFSRQLADIDAEIRRHED